MERTGLGQEKREDKWARRANQAADPERKFTEGREGGRAGQSGPRREIKEQRQEIMESGHDDE